MGTSARRLALLLGLVAFSACECTEGDGGFTQLVPLLSPDAARVTMPPVYVGATKQTTLRYHSTGTGNVEVAGVTLVNASKNGFALEDPGAKALSPGATLEVVVAYAPVSEGDAHVDVVVNSDADNAPTSIRLEVKGLAPLDCGPSTTCQRRTFEPDTGACIVENLSGPCDDGNACTTDDVCFEGSCVGTAVTCPSPHECTQGLCDADEGCILLAHDDRCEDDGNPCTAERCDLEEGCVSEELPDGTPCGAVTMCASAALCYQGACTVFDVPDGTPCSDGDFCTVNDRCYGGECSGTRVEQPPVVAGEVRLFGTEGGRAVLLSGRRVLFLDPPTQSPSVDGYVATVVQANEDGLVVLAQTELPQERLPWGALEASPGVVVGFTVPAEESAGWIPQRLEIAADGAVVVASVGEPSDDLSPFASAALPDGRVAVRGGRARLSLLDPSDLSHTVLVDWSPDTPDEGPFITELEAFAGGIAVALDGELLFVHLDGSVEALGEDLGVVSNNGLDSDGGVLAALWRHNAPSGSTVQVVLYDEALEELGRVPLDPDARQIALDGGRLVVGRSGPALAYDVSDPTSPVLLAQSLPWSTRSVEHLDATAGIALFAGNRIFNTQDVSSVVASLDEGGLAFLLHPRLGSPGALISLGDEVLSAARTSFHRLDVAINGMPLVFEGSPLARPLEAESSRWLPLVRKGSGAVLPHGWRPIASASQLWVYDLTLPVVPPFPQRTLRLSLGGRLASNTRLVVGVEQSGPVLSQTLQVFDALAQPPPAETNYPPLSVTPLLWSLEDMATGHTPAVAIDEAGHIAVVSQPTSGDPRRVEVLLFDAAPPAPPVLTGRAVLELPGPPPLLGGLQATIAGSAVAITDFDAGATSDPTAVLVLRRLPDSSVVETMRFRTDAYLPMAFDGRTLILGQPRSKALSFWDVSGVSPTDLGIVELPDEPQAVVSYADTLLVSGQSSFVTLEPPCPPLP